ncbi:MAG: RidA family protein [Promethearchaeota archaeon]
MTRKNISSGSPFEIPIGFSRAVKIGNIISVSGTAPIAPDGTTVCKNDVYGQTKYSLGIIEKAIEDAGGSLENVIRTRILMKNITKWEEAAKAHGEFFSKIRPACTFMEVKGFINLDWQIEIEADCVIDNDDKNE